MKEAIDSLNRDSSRTLWLCHNQAIIIGSSLAESGIADKIDFFMRDQEARMEVLTLVAEGRAEDVLTAKTDQEPISGMYLSRLMNDRYRISPYYRTQLLDVASSLLEPTTSAVMPIVKASKNGDKTDVGISGLAVFKGDKMIGRLDNATAMGYVWAMGEVMDCMVEVKDGQDEAALQAVNVDTKKDVGIRPDGGVRVSLSVDATLAVSELKGFQKMSAPEVIPRLVKMTEDEIGFRITECFETARTMGADIYGFGELVHKTHRDEWKTMSGNWDEIFRDCELDVTVKATIPATGQIVRSIKMGGAGQ